MARRRLNAMPTPPPASGGYEFEVIVLGPPVYHTTPPPAKARGPLISMGDGEGLPSRPAPGADHQHRSKVPLVPTKDEIEKLPRLAQVAFATRCVQRMLSTSTDAAAYEAPDAAARAARCLFDTATIDTPLTAQLRCIRRDFARLKRLAREQKWTDDTTVLPEVFGPLWPPETAPYWATESVEPTPSSPK
jgi:hypothetical protein